MKLRSRRFARRLGFGPAFFVFLLSLLLLGPRPGWTAEGDQPTGKTVAVPAAPSTDEPKAEPPQRLLDLTSGIRDRDLDWREHFERAPGETLTPEAQAALEVARAGGYARKQCVADIKAGGEKTKTLFRNLDVGRHAILKHLYARALIVLNERRKAKGEPPLRKVLPVNAGGTGDYTRDQDITVFSGDPEAEKAYFQAIEDVARNELKLEVDLKKTGGIDFPQIEVTLFPGGNDVPDSRFATDVEAFKLRYTEVLEKQKADVEAYLGGASDIEVKGRRRPGQMYVQEITFDDEGRIGYRCEVPGNQREATSLFHEPGPERFHAWQRSSHIFSNYLQGWRHFQHDKDPTKGSLKYLGRDVEQLCHLAGRPIWNEKTSMDEKIATIARVFPELDPRNPDQRKVLEKRVQVFEIGLFVKTNKKLPEGVDGERMAMTALILLRKTVAATAGEMAKQMLYPPSFDSRDLRPEERARYNKMTPAERFKYLKERDAIYRACVAHEAMENLLLTVAMLNVMDAQEEKASRSRRGAEAIRAMIDNAPPEIRRVLQQAAEYTETAARLETAKSPQDKARLRAKLLEIRNRLSADMPGGRLPGQELVEKMERLGPRKYVEEVLAGRKPPLGVDTEELKARFDEHIKQAFPSMAEEYKQFREKVDKLGGAKGYIYHRLGEELFQLDTIADALTLVEMYQKDASLSAYAEFCVVNVLSRLHWSCGQLIAALRVRNEEDLKALGKNLVFMTLSRLVPWAGQAKIVFDIARGIVTVTVGWAISVVNADLVDALYTGEAGRTDMDAAGTARGALRDSGFCVLDPSCVFRETDEDSGELRIVVNRAAVYEQAFRKWTGGLDPFDIPRTGSPPAAAAALVEAHDALARILLLQAEQEEPTWVYSSANPRVPMPLFGDEVEKAISAALKVFTASAGAEAEQVHSESGARSYKSYFDTEDAIVRGLRERYAMDVFSGMLDAWQTRITAQILAMREIERTAIQADYARIAESVHGAVGKYLARGAATDEANRPVYELDVRVDGVLRKDEDAYDGGQPVRVSGFVKGSGDVGENPPEVRIEVVPGTPKVIAKGVRKGEDPAKKDTAKIEPGDLIEDEVTVRAVPKGGGAPLAEATQKVRIRLPSPSGPVTSVPVLKHEERRSDGTLSEVFEYVKSFLGMPAEWVEDSGYVYHGAFDRYTSPTPNQKTEERQYRFGVLDGPSRFYDSQGRLVMEIPYVNGKFQGTKKQYDPDSQARLELDYTMDWLDEQRSYAEDGQILRKISYRKVDDPEGRGFTMSGTAEAWWPNGGVRWRGAYEKGWQDLNERGGYDGETVVGKSGEWEWFYEDGSPKCRCEYRNGLEDGRFEAFRQGGGLSERGTNSKGKRNGTWETYDETGEIQTRGDWADGKPDGNWERFAEGKRFELGSYRAGLRDGHWTVWDADGRVQSEGDWAADRMTGAWFETANWGTEEWRGVYRDGKRTGPWTYHRVEGEKRWLAANENYAENELDGDYESYDEGGKVTGKGSYRAGRRVGPWVERYRGLREEGSYVDGDRSGAWRTFSESADGDFLYCTGSYKAGQRDGRFTWYDSKGKVDRWKEYRDGEVVGEGSD